MDEEELMNSLPTAAPLSPISAALAAQTSYSAAHPEVAGPYEEEEEQEEEYEEDEYYQPDGEEYVEPAAPAMSLPEIQLSFGGGGKGGAWDDRELISAFDAAKEEFEVSQSIRDELFLSTRTQSDVFHLDDCIQAIEPSRFVNSRMQPHLTNTSFSCAIFFRQLHNPGPGSWLDKATAALALGQPLPGAVHGSSK